jgi:protein-S-isoprenylcysteine O-methyltransferase Ste14
MKGPAADNSSVSGAPDHAGVRVPPPLIYLAVFLVALGLQRLLPLPAIPKVIGFGAGPIVIAPGIAFAAWSVGLFRRAGTSLIPIKPTTALVINGPYHFTRNPMYLSLLSIYVGAALMMRTLWVLLLLPFVIVAIRYLVIRKEEQYLQRKFGEAFLSYKASVRRWI